MDKIIGTFLWGMLQNKLQQMWIPTQWVNFNDINSINDFAKQILPQMLKSNPQMKDVIKQNISSLDKETQNKVVEVIDSI